MIDFGIWAFGSLLGFLLCGEALFKFSGSSLLGLGGGGVFQFEIMNF
jgi:hypothetical protein